MAGVKEEWDCDGRKFGRALDGSIGSILDGMAFRVMPRFSSAGYWPTGEVPQQPGWRVSDWDTM